MEGIGEITPDTEVSTASTSNVFHILRHRVDNESQDKVEICGSFNTYSNNPTLEYPSVEEALSDGLRLCNGCENIYQRLTGSEMSVCDICGSLGVRDDVSVLTKRIPHGPNEGEKFSWCTQCMSWGGLLGMSNYYPAKKSRE